MGKHQIFCLSYNACLCILRTDSQAHETDHSEYYAANFQRVICLINAFDGVDSATNAVWQAVYPTRNYYTVYLQPAE